MKRSLTMKAARGAALAATVGIAAGLVVATPSVAAEEGTLMKDLLGRVGIIPEDKDPIVYRERPGLVVPPKMDLPPPSAAAAPVTRSADWPVDQDVARARKRKEAANEPRRLPSDKDPSQGGRLSIDQMRAGFRPGAGVPTQGDQDNMMGERKGERMTPDQLRALGTKTTKDELLAYGQEPTRQYLTDPPAGLRVPSSTAPIPRRNDSAPLTLPSENDTGQRAFLTGKKESDDE